MNRMFNIFGFYHVDSAFVVARVNSFVLVHTIPHILGITAMLTHTSEDNNTLHHTRELCVSLTLISAH